MAGITDHVYRLMLRRIGGVGLVTMEFISSEAIVRGNARQLRKMVFSDEERPLSIQIYGSDPERMAAAADIVEELAPDVCDINMGCPANKVLKGCAGAALMGDLPLARRIVRAVKARLSIPLTVKFRLGLDERRQNFLDLGKMCEDEGVAAVAMHARTARQMYTGQADRRRLAELKGHLSIPVVGNGDVATPQDALELLSETGCDAVMIGRATMKNPWIFRQIADAMAGRPVREATLCGAARSHARALRRDRGDRRRSARGAAQAAHDDRLVHERPAARPGAAGPHLGAGDPGRLPGRGRGRVLRRARGDRAPRRPAAAARSAPAGFRSSRHPGQRLGRSRRGSREFSTARSAVRWLSMKLQAPVGVLLLAAMALSRRGAQAQSSQTQVSTEGGKFPLYVTAEYLGMAGVKTVVRVRLRAPELSMAAAKRGLTSFSGELKGNFVERDQVVESFHYPVSGEISERIDLHLRVPPRARARRLHAPALARGPGRSVVGQASIELVGPRGRHARSRRTSRPGRSERCRRPRRSSSRTRRAARPRARSSKLKILPPDREAPIGLLRLDAVSRAARSSKVEFWLEDKLLVRRTRPPYSVEIDLGDVPRRQTVRAVGYDASGKLIDEDAWSINQGSARLAVKILPAGGPGRGQGAREGRRAVDRRAESPSRSSSSSDEKKLKSWEHAGGPYEVTIPFTEYSKGELPARDRGRARTARRPTTSGCSRGPTRRSRTCASTSSSSTSPRSTRATTS